jgi:hypothetical protein
MCFPAVFSAMRALSFWSLHRQDKSFLIKD